MWFISLFMYMYMSLVNQNKSSDVISAAESLVYLNTGYGGCVFSKSANENINNEIMSIQEQ